MSVQFNIENYPERPSEYNDFLRLKDQYSKNSSLSPSIMQPPIDSLSSKITTLQSIRQQFEKYIENYNKTQSGSNNEKLEKNKILLEKAKLQLEVQKENMNNAVNRTTANKNNTGFFMFGPLSTLGMRLLQGFTILFGILSIYMIVNIIYTPKTTQITTTSQPVGIFQGVGGAFKKIIKQLKE
jgi:hypothetical protein